MGTPLVRPPYISRGRRSRGIWTRSSALQLSRQVTCDFHADFGFLDLWFQHSFMTFSILVADLTSTSLGRLPRAPFARPLGRTISHISFFEKGVALVAGAIALT